MFFKCRLKMSIELLDLSSSGIEFHSLGAATANALSPYVFSLAFEVGKKKKKLQDDNYNNSN